MEDLRNDYNIDFDAEESYITVTERRERLKKLENEKEETAKAASENK
jgi:hypothetical protein